jgi:hypothetical protein
MGTAHLALNLLIRSNSQSRSMHCAQATSSDPVQLLGARAAPRGATHSFSIYNQMCGLGTK